jgi:high affinity sulfate transporter 1
VAVVTEVGKDDSKRAPLILSSLRGYQAAWLGKDISAGLAVAAVGLPSAIAYPAIAGLPPETGLYASIAPLVAYAVFGPSRRLMVGPDAATMTVLAAVLASIMAQAPAGTDRVALAGLIAVTVGFICLAGRLMRLGVLATFLSRPILTGFFAGISLDIIIGQIKRFTGVSVEAGGLVAPFVEILQRAGEIHVLSLIFAVAMLALIFVLKAVKSPLPGPVVVVVLSVLLSWVFDFQGRGMAVVGDIPQTLPRLRLPSIEGIPLDAVLSGAMAVFLVSFGAGIITAKSFGAMDGQKVDSNRELEGFGAANLAAGLFGAFPVTSSDSRTAINFSVGGRTQLTSIMAALTLLATILYLGGALRILPIPALGAILVGAAIGLIDVAALARIWKVSRVEFVVAMIALWGPIGLGVLQGVILAIGVTFGYLIWKSMFPHLASLGLIPGRDGFYKLHRHPEARPEPGLALCVVQGNVLFVNADHVRDGLMEMVEGLPAGTDKFVLDAGAIAQIDVTGAEMFAELAETLAARGVRLGLAETNTEVRHLLRRAGVLDLIGAEMVFEDVGDALRAHRAGRGAAADG